MLNWFDFVVAVLLLFTLVRGFATGFVMQTVSLLGVVLGAFFSGKLAQPIAENMIRYTDADSHIVGPASYIVAFLIVFLIVFFLLKLIQSFINAVKLNALNRLIGALFCSLKWFVVASILLNIVVEFDQNEKIVTERVRDHSYSYFYVKNLITEIVPYLRFDWLEGLK